MSSYQANLPNATIDVGFASSSVIVGIEDAWALAIYAPADLTSTVTVRISTNTSAVTGSNAWSDAQSGGSDITLAAGNAVTISTLAAGSVLLVSAATVSVRAEFAVQKMFKVM